MLIAVNYTLPIAFYTSKLVIYAYSGAIFIALTTTHRFSNLRMNQDLFAAKALIKVCFLEFSFSCA